MSVSEALRAIRYAMGHWFEVVDRDETLRARLATATRDDYERGTKKAARFKPNFKDKPSEGRPIVKTATREQKRACNALKSAC